MDYFIKSNGKDSNSGLSQSDAWKTFANVLADPAVIALGNTVWIEAGMRIEGTGTDTAVAWKILNKRLSTSQLASGEKEFVISQLGTGPKPRFTGARTITSWTSLGGNKYKTNLPDMIGREMTAVYRDDQLTPKGRFPKATEPNGGYITNTVDYSYNQDTELTSPEFEAIAAGYPTDHFVGAEMAAKTRQSVIDKCNVVSYSGSLITTTPRFYGMYAGFGFFFQNREDFCTLDSEWAFDKNTGDLIIYSDTDPSIYKYEYAYYDRVMELENCSHIIFADIIFEKSRQDTIMLAEQIVIVDGVTQDATVDNYCEQIWLRRCETNLNGRNGFYGWSNLCFLNVDGKDTQNNSFEMKVAHNTQMRMHHTDNHLVPGMGESGTNTHCAFKCRGYNYTLEKSSFKNVGYTAVDYREGPLSIFQVMVDRFCLIMADGGAICTNRNFSTKGNKVMFCKVSNGVGNVDGAGHDVYDDVPKSRGYYNDAASTGNTLYGVFSEDTGEGMIMHQGGEIVYDSAFVASQGSAHRAYWDDNIGVEGAPQEQRGVAFNDNLLVNVHDIIPSIEVWSQKADDADKFGSIDFNRHVQVLGSVDPGYTYMFRHDSGSVNKIYVGERTVDEFFYGNNDTLMNIARPLYKNVLEASVNMLLNSDFSSAPSLSNGNFGEETAASSDSFRVGTATGIEGMNGQVMRCYFLDPLAGDKGVVVYKSIPVVKGKYYRIRSKVKGEIAGEMLFTLRTGSTGDRVHENKVIPINTTTHDFSFIFTPKEGTDALRFLVELKAAYGTVWFDDFEMHEVTVEKQDWREFIHTVHNYSYEKAALPAPGAGWVDRTGQDAPSSVTLPGYGFEVYFKILDNLPTVGNQYIEAESAVATGGAIGADWTTETEADPAGGDITYIRPTAYAGEEPTTDAQTVSYYTENLSAGDYKIWVKAKSAGAGADAFFIQVDGAAWVKCNNFTAVPGNDGTIFMWNPAWLEDDIDNHLTFSLSEGVHEIRLGRRENFKIDKLYITKDGDVPVSPSAYALEENFEGTVIDPAVLSVSNPNPSITFEQNAGLIVSASGNTYVDSAIDNLASSVQAFTGDMEMTYKMEVLTFEQITHLHGLWIDGDNYFAWMRNSSGGSDVDTIKIRMKSAGISNSQDLTEVYGSYTHFRISITGSEARFLASADGINFTQLGTTFTGAPAGNKSFFVSTADHEFGARVMKFNELKIKGTVVGDTQPQGIGSMTIGSTFKIN